MPQAGRWSVIGSRRLSGLVQEGPSTYRAGLIIQSGSDAENLCPCHDSRQRGIICAHSVALGFQYLNSRAPVSITRFTKVSREGFWGCQSLRHPLKIA
ncbi:hypothetical protein SBV1_2390012 [Verrucomicrobia bacterium]|nr:hypothetical protein SBV1_2390012 [Verrucomicrobiota bacterium]